MTRFWAKLFGRDPVEPIQVGRSASPDFELEDAVAANAAAQAALQRVQARGPEVTAVAQQLLKMRLDNHFAQMLEASMARDRRQGKGGPA